MKKWTFLALALCLALALTGCHSSGEGRSFQLPDTFDDSRNFELTFWATR